MDESNHTAALHKLVDQYTAATASTFKPDLPRAIELLDDIITRCITARELLQKKLAKTVPPSA